MDGDNLAWLEQRCPAPHQAKLGLLSHHHVTLASREVPDPYSGDAAGFDHVLDLVENACDGLVAHLRQRLSGP